MDKHIQTISGHWLKLLICSLAVLGTQVHGGYNLKLTLVEGAVEKGAVCLDGTAPAYYYDPGVGNGANNWVIFLQGGAWCMNEGDCIWRINNLTLGSSLKMAQVTNIQGILSPNQTENPEFYSWNRVYVNYCDGASFAGEVEEVNPKNNLHFRGARIFDAVVEDLLAKGMKTADNVILSGQSAGGLATILHCDRFRAQVPNAKRLKCLSDGGYFIRGNDIPGTNQRIIEHPFGDIVKYHGIDKFLPKSCTSKMDPKLCLFPENLVGDIKTPLFLVNGAFDYYQITQKVPQLSMLGICKINATACTSDQIKILREFRTSFIKALPKGDCSKIGMFIDSANNHDHIMVDKARWYGPNAPRLKNKTPAEGFADWYFDRSCFQEIDFEHDTPQNF